MNVDHEYLDRYHLKANNGILASAEHDSIYTDMLENLEGLGVRFSPGCTTQNSIRVAQWYMREEAGTSIVGCIGGDSVGEEMLKLMQNAGIRTEFQVDSGASTGLCAVLVSTGDNRSMVTRLGAGRHLKHSYLMSPTVWNLVEQARIFYITGFLLNDNLESVIEIGKHSAVGKKCFIFNISAPYLSGAFTEEMRSVLMYSDVVMGNSDEANALAHSFGLNSKDLPGIIREIAALPKVNPDKSRVVIITQGPENIIVFENGVIKEFPVIKIHHNDIVDTNGAGDGFVGGFLSELVRDRNVDVCVLKGIEAAHMIMGMPGCTLPPRSC